jgi:hypothetical protein
MAAATTPTPMLADMRVGLAAAPPLCAVATGELTLALLETPEEEEVEEEEEEEEEAAPGPAAPVPAGLRCVVDGIAVPHVCAPLGQQPQKPSARKLQVSLPVQ